MKLGAELLGRRVAVRGSSADRAVRRFAEATRAGNQVDMETATLSARRATRSPWAELLGRLGFAAKGVLYAIVAVIAIKVAAGQGGNPEDQKGALATLADEPFGMVLLVALALGLSGYALWRLVEIVVGQRDKDGVEDYAERAASVGRAIVYGALAAFAWAIVAGSGGRASSSGSEKQQTAMVLDWPGGVALVTIVGIIVIAIAVYQGYEAARHGFLDDLELARMSENERRTATFLGTIGHAARGVVFALIGVFLVKAAFEYDPSEAIGLDGALKELAGQPYGSVLLGLVATGLLLYALYCLVEARYRKL
jgi:Domain of Unknown Function (DUF1206)